MPGSSLTVANEEEPAKPLAAEPQHPRRSLETGRLLSPSSVILRASLSWKWAQQHLNDLGKRLLHDL